MDTNRILLVDDDQSVLDGLCRQHRKNFALFPACGHEEGLRAVAEEGPFAVVVTDFQMPGMNGIQFLTKVAELDPDMIRIMLTGQANMQTAIDAINRGQIFRFLNKPVDPAVLRSCLDAALEQYRLRNAERDLLEQTVCGSIEVLAEVLAMTNPVAFGKATRIRGLVRHIVQYLDLADGWQYETAALLSQIGLVAVPDKLVERMMAGESLPPEQAAMLERHPSVARELLIRIPRLHVVAEMVARQKAPAGPASDSAIHLGGRMLAAALEFEEMLSVGATHLQALDALKQAGKKYDKGVLDALATAKLRVSSEVILALPVRQLRVGMLVQEEVRNSDGNLIVSQGHQITEGSLRRLQNYSELGQLERSELRVQLPADHPEITELPVG